MFHGHATPEGTREYLRRVEFPPGAVRVVPGFTMGALVLGTRGGRMSEDDTARYTQALSYGLKHGTNMLDTGLSWRGQRSERLVGRVLDKKIRRGMERSFVAVATRAGLVPGDTDAALPPFRLLATALLGPGVVGRNDTVNAGGGHACFTVPFFSWSLETSRANLGLTTVDLHYVEEPWILRRVRGEEALVEALRALFVWYEEQRSLGTVRFYGISSTRGLAVPPGDPDHLPLERLVRAAAEAGGPDHGLRFLQIPVNPSEQAALAAPTQPVDGSLEPALQAARRLGLTVVAIRPLAGGELGPGASAALESVLATPDVTLVAAGMRRYLHVRDNLRVVRRFVPRGGEY